MLKKVLFQFNKVKEQGSFIRNVTIVSTWNVLGILSQFILSPIITRLYTPDQYGSFALFSTIVVNAVLVSSLRYSEAIVITKTPEQRNNTIFLSFILVLSITILSILGTFLFQNQLQKFIGVALPNYFIYVIPMAILLGGVLEILLTINVWRGKFFNNGFAGFLTNILSRCFTISDAVFFQANVVGLIGGDLVGKMVGVTGVLLSFKNLKSKIYTFCRGFNFNAIKLAAHHYIQFPLYTLPTNLFILLSGSLPIYFFQFQYTSGVVGYYALSSSLLEMINRLIPYSVASVFLPKAVELKKISLTHLAETAYKLYGVILILSIGIFSGFSLFSRYIFPWIFGASWETAGIYMGILSLYYSFHFIAISLSEVYKVLGKQRFLLVTTVISVLLKSFAIFLAVYFEENVLNAIFWFCIANSIGSIIQILGVFVIFRFKVWQVCFSLLTMMAMFIILIRLVNF